MFQGSIKDKTFSQHKLEEKTINHCIEKNKKGLELNMKNIFWNNFFL